MEKWPLPGLIFHPKWLTLDAENLVPCVSAVIETPIALELPNQWLWDIVDEFIYQVCHRVTVTGSQLQGHSHRVTVTGSQLHGHSHRVTVTGSQSQGHSHMVTVTWSQSQGHSHRVAV